MSKYAHLEKDTNKILGWYDKEIHKTIPTPNVEVENDVWKEALNINANTYDEAVQTFVIKDFRTLKELKASKLSSINTSCEAVIVSGFTSSALGSEHIYQSDRDDQINLMGLVTTGKDDLLKCGVDDGDGNITWEWKQHTVTQLKAVFDDGAAFKMLQLIKANTLKVQISSATTVEEVNEIVW